MRCRVTLGGMRGKGIPVDYHYFLSSSVYRWIKMGNEELAEYLHYSKDIKPFTFSEIYARGKVVDENITFSVERGSFIFSSHRRDIVEAFVEGALSSPVLKIKNEEFPVDKIEILKESEIKERMRFKTLSPIVISISRAEARENEKRYLYPTDTMWYANFEKNIKRRYEVFSGEKYEGKINVRVVNYQKPKKYKIKGGYVRASKLVFEILGNPEIIKIGYQSGFGERTAQGFGCVEVWKEKKEFPHKTVLV